MVQRAAAHAGRLQDGLDRRGFVAAPAEVVARSVDEVLSRGIAALLPSRHREGEGDELARIEPQLRVLQTPTLLVWGTDDVYFGLPWAYWLRDVLPGVRTLVELPGGGLFVQPERTREVANAVLEHWAACPAPSVGLT